MEQREVWEQKRDACRNQAEKFERMSENSLDDKNKKKYAARAKQWRDREAENEERIRVLENKAEPKKADKIMEKIEDPVAIPENNDIINQGRPLEMFNFSDISLSEAITPDYIIDELEKTDTGRTVLTVIENLPVPIKFIYGEYDSLLRGSEENGKITIYLNNCKNVLWSARTVIHECTHFQYGIGQSQWAECVCVAQELKHARGRNKLTVDELKKIIRAVKDVYPEYNWRKGGIIYGRRTSR